MTTFSHDQLALERAEEEGGPNRISHLQYAAAIGDVRIVRTKPARTEEYFTVHEPTNGPGLARQNAFEEGDFERAAELEALELAAN